MSDVSVGNEPWIREDRTERLTSRHDLPRPGLRRPIRLFGYVVSTVLAWIQACSGSDLPGRRSDYWLGLRLVCGDRRTAEADGSSWRPDDADYGKRTTAASIDLSGRGVELKITTTKSIVGRYVCIESRRRRVFVAIDKDFEFSVKRNFSDLPVTIVSLGFVWFSLRRLG